MITPRFHIGLLLSWATACTVVVPVGVDPVVPDWQGLPPTTAGTGTTGSGCPVPNPTPEWCDGVDNDGDCAVDEGQVCERVTTFTQVADLDILFVLDPREESAGALFKLREALPSLLGPLSLTQREVHVGAVSMDAEDPQHRGRLLSPRGDRFAVVGFDGEYQEAEEFLQRAFELLEPPMGRVAGRYVTREALAANRPWNEAFVRDGGYLGIVFLSTTDDLQPPSVNQLVTELEQLWLPGRYSMSAIVQVRPIDCNGVDNPGDLGATYRSLWNATEGGVLADHCLPSYHGVLHELAESLAARSITDTFVLIDPALVDTIEIELNLGDGFVALPRERYQIGADRRSILLDRPPPPDARIRVSYTADP